MTDVRWDIGDIHLHVLARFLFIVARRWDMCSLFITKIGTQFGLKMTFLLGFG